MESYEKVIAVVKNTQYKTQNTILNTKYNIKTKKTSILKILCFFKLKFIVYQNDCFQNLKKKKKSSQAWRIPWTVQSKGSQGVVYN